ncbi:MAG: DUF4395 domain-containing protein [Solirubrobacteraceae bacterium]|nr:DUF4395 domain-containing protein [Solirubrobacteraceae bacterium]
MSLHPSFPNPVNELAARSVAGLVVLTSVLAIAAQLPWLSIVLAVGFLLRVLWGPRFDPFGQLATKVIAPRLGHARLVPGPPKRFAQGMGTVFTTVAALLFFALDATTAGYAVLGVLVVAASLEAFAGFCLGCQVFALLMRAGVIPESVCEDCSDIWARRAAA